jgi:EAL domain-containing protein (putative c-di-GMP-specific phosphodiesterase class I)
MTERFYLESSKGQARLPRRLDLVEFPATIGRHPDCSVQLNVDRISRLHARLDMVDDQLHIEDLGSTNGTYVNHERISARAAVSVGDVVHLADHEFRLMREKIDTIRAVGPVSSAETVIGMNPLPRQFPLQMSAMLDLLETGKVQAYAQSIYHADGDMLGWELLGRSTHPDLTEGPGQLFSLAAALDAEVRLSRLLRHTAFAAAHRAGLDKPLFFNNHPTECRDFDSLLADLRDLRGKFPDLQLVFEMHEGAVTDLEVMADVKSELKSMNIELAYDDFGAGQARLLELIEVPPDYLKFDISLVRGLEDRNSPKYRLLATLHDLISGLGIRTLAEGIETRTAADCCREIGIDYLQGYLFSRPQPV